MKNNTLFLMIMTVFIYSCDTKQENKAIENTIKKAAQPPLQVTFISTLPDSLQPKSIALSDMPKPLTVAVPSKTGGFYSKTNSKGEVTTINLEALVIKPLAVLQNEKGVPVLDPQGKPFIMGDGGKSNFTNFTTDNGLALDAVWCSAMDKSGNIWFGTDGGGVSCYGGNKFRTFTTAQGLANNIVDCILEDKSGNIWFGTGGGGVSLYDGNKFTTFTTAQGLANNNVNCISEDKTGNIWFGTYGEGVSRYEPPRDGQAGKFTSFTTAQGLANNTVLCISEDKTGNIWFGTYRGGVSRYEGNKFTTFTTTQGLVNNSVTCILEDKTGNLWFGTHGGISKYNGNKFTTFTTAQGLANNSVVSIVEDKTGILWFGTWGGGVSRYEPPKDGQAGTFTSFTTAQGLANIIVKSITEDKNGNLWFGTYGGGVSRYDGKTFTSFTTDQGLANNTVLSILEDKMGNLWFGTFGGGMSRYDGKTFTSFTTAQGLAIDYVTCILEDKTGNLWFGTSGGVSLYNGKTFTSFTTAQGLAKNYLNCITEDKTGNLWFGTSGGGVSRYDGNKFTTFTTAQGLANNLVTCISEDKTGNLWFGTRGGGVSRYEPPKDGQAGTFTSFTTAQGLANNNVTCIVKDKTGNLWFGTTEGLSILPVESLKEMLSEKSDLRHPDRNKEETTDKGKGFVESEVEGKANISSSLFKSFTITDGLPDNNVTSIIQMPDGKMAVGTNLGITLFNPSEDFTQLSNLQIYNSNTGYPVKAVQCMILDSKGIIWAGTGSDKTALVRFDYAALQKSAEPPTLLIQSVKVKDENICWHCLQSKGVRKNNADSATTKLQEFFAYGKTLSSSENEVILKRFGNIQFDSITKFYPLPQNLVLPYEHNQISFDFAAIETSRPFLVKYQYMLEGYDKNWSPITGKSNASFGNINEGTYTFKLKAQGANGVWTEPSTYTFKVLPPWYRSWWAYGFYLLLISYAGWKLHVYQKAKTIKREREKAQERELEHAKEIEIAYTELGKSHENLKSTQAQLIQSEKMASLGELTAGIAHEIQNPLNFVNNFSEVSNELIDEMNAELNKGDIEEAKAISSDIKQNLEKINHHGKRAADIVKGMLQHSSAGSGKKEPTDINALADEYLRLAYHGLRAKDKSFNATMKTDFDETIGNINIIPQDIGRVILNLINNAFYAVDEKKKQQTEGYEPTVSISTKKTGDKIEIKVADNGNGIPQKILDKIFQPFFTTKPTGQGTGLGLSLSYDIVKAHGGSLEVISIDGMGSEFIIQLPVF